MILGQPDATHFEGAHKEDRIVFAGVTPWPDL